ncbi:hypothetical protein N431DRAFT_356005 [Stipitochalara longipes BDJ]|nr:hypothetical protein N431DRAFT_356005 [Stipitochalara longipes BDJ]
MENNPEGNLEGTYNDPANTFVPEANARIIPAFLFDDGDPSEGFFDYSNSVFKNLPIDSVANWTEACSSPEAIFSSDSSLGSFIGCLLYANITRNLASGSMVTNASDNTFLSDNSEQISLDLRSTYTTCLTGYCATQAECALSNICDVGNLLTSNYELSAQGVTKCWLKLCTPNVQTANPDIAGVGILLSYLTQSVIALLGFVALAGLGYGVYRKQKRLSKSALNRGLTGLTLNDESANSKEQKRGKTVEDQYIVVCATLAEFHKAQCYFTIALQIATFVIVYSKTTRVIFVDQTFLLIVSIDGLIPVAMTLYTLMTFGKRSWYMIGLSMISMILSTANGIHIINTFTTYTAAPGLGSAACGGVGPAALCYVIGANDFIFTNTLAVFYYRLIMSIMDIVGGSLVIWKILTESTPWWSILTRGVANKLAAGRKSKSEVTADDLHRANKIDRRIQLWTAICFHSIIVLAFLACYAIVFYLFSQLFTSPYVDLKGWGFGQIVGITIWMGVLLELVYLEWNGIEEGLEWRLPKWIKVEEREEKPGHLVITLEEMEFGQQAHGSDEMGRDPKVAHVSVGEEYGRHIT